MATVGAPRGQVMTPRPGRPGNRVRHGGYIVWEVVLAILVVALAVAVKDHPAPLPGDSGVSVAWQHLLLPHHALASAVEDVSTVAWPVPQAVVLAGVTFVLLTLRRCWRW